MALYYDDLDDEWVSRILSAPGYGWHLEFAVASLRMVTPGIFDGFPKPRIIIDHMGEGIPFQYSRAGDNLAAICKDRLQKSIQQYFHDNFQINTSTVFREGLLTLVV